LSALALAAAGAPLILSAPAAHAAAAGTRASHLVVADYGIDKIHKESGSNPDASEYPHGGILAVDASNAAQALIAKDGLMHTPRGSPTTPTAICWSPTSGHSTRQAHGAEGA
jgi:hypothetical protein